MYEHTHTRTQDAKVFAGAQVLLYDFRYCGKARLQRICVFISFYGVATISRLLKIIGLFCSKAL